jgi:hypothetical protein
MTSSHTATSIYNAARFRVKGNSTYIYIFIYLFMSVCLCVYILSIYGVLFRHVTDIRDCCTASPI